MAITSKQPNSGQNLSTANNYFLLVFFVFFLLAFPVEGKQAPKIALLWSTHTQSALPEHADWVNDNLADWEIYLLNHRLVYKVITSKELENGINGYDLIILPSAICLSEKEKAAIKKFLHAGGGVFAIGGIGSRNEVGKQQGWNFLSTLFGVEVTGEIELEESASLTIKANSPLSYGVPPGFKLEVTTKNGIRPLAVKVVGGKTSAVGYWYDFQPRPDSPTTAADRNCALIYGEYQQGRFVWLGFEKSASVAVKSVQVIRDRILSNSISWLRREPVGWFNPWPDGRRETKAAVVLICDAEHRFSQTLNAAKILNKEGLSGTFFLVPEEAINNSKATAVLTENGEVGLHGVAVYRWQPYEEQFSRLKEGKDQLEELTGKRILGFHPPEELYDSSTIKALTQLGFQYLCGDDVMDRTCPIIIGIENRGRKTGNQSLLSHPSSSDDRRLMVFPKGRRSDYDLLVKEKIQGTTEIFNALKQDFLRAYEVQGAYFLLYHSHLLCAENNILALERFVEFCKGKNVWFTTCKEMADWWQGFENISLTVGKSNSSRRIEVKVTNSSKFGVENLRIFVAPPEPVKNVSIKLQGTKVPEYEIKEDGRVVAFKVKSLGPYASQTYFIDCR